MAEANGSMKDKASLICNIEEVMDLVLFLGVAV